MSTSGNTVPPTRDKQVAMLQTTIDGLQKHESSLSSLMIQGKSYTVSGLVTILQARLAATTAAATTRATWQNAVKTDNTGRENTKVLVSGLRQALLVAFSGQVDVLADFGLVGRKPRVISPEAQVVAVQKAKATRIARHTMGKNQKSAIKGDVTTVTITPVTSGTNGGAVTAASPVASSTASGVATPAAPAASASSSPSGTATSAAPAHS